MSVSQPVIVLVHGAWADASSWSSVISELQRRGFTVYAPPNPLRGLPQDSAYLHQFLTQNAALQGQPIVLAGGAYAPECASSSCRAPASGCCTATAAGTLPLLTCTGS
jgi:pimeloyl-ACP methyl ester carboxylesterase